MTRLAAINTRKVVLGISGGLKRPVGLSLPRTQNECQKDETVDPVSAKLRQKLSWRFGRTMKRLAAEKFLGDLTFELDTVGAVSGHVLSSFEARRTGQLLSSPLSNPRGPLQIWGQSSTLIDTRPALGSRQ
jgi:hypothetical protein